MKENYLYPAKLTNEDGMYQIRFVDFPDMILIEAETKDEVIHDAQEALALTIIDIENVGETLPEPSNPEENVVYIHVWMPYYRNSTKEIYVRKNVTIPLWLDILAKEKRISYSAELVKGIKLTLGIEH